MKERIKNFRAKHETLYQLLLFTLLSGVATIVDFAVFSALNYWLLIPIKSVPFSWWILDYSASNGGLGGFIATAAAYLAAQTANFFVQRKGTFKANNNPVASGIMYFAMVIAIWFLQLYLGGVLMGFFGKLLGQTLGDFAARIANNTVSFAIQFPLNKFVIMRKSDKTRE